MLASKACEHVALDDPPKSIERQAIGLQRERLFKLMAQRVQSEESIGYEKDRQQRPPVERSGQREGQGQAEDQCRALEQQGISKGHRSRGNALASAPPSELAQHVGRLFLGEQTLSPWCFSSRRHAQFCRNACLAAIAIGATLTLTSRKCCLNLSEATLVAKTMTSVST